MTGAVKFPENFEAHCVRCAQKQFVLMPDDAFLQILAHVHDDNRISKKVGLDNFCMILKTKIKPSSSGALGGKIG